MVEKIVQFQNIEYIVAIFGNYDENVELLEKEFNVKITNRDENIKISGEPDAVTMTARAIDALIDMVKGCENITDQSIRYIISLVKENIIFKAKVLSGDCVCITAGGKPIRAKTLGQKQYLDAIKNNTITLGVGPAGTGKTYLAVAMAVRAFRAQEISRIILTRPAVEAGEKLGFLPGDLQSKVDPYLRPLYDALFDMFGAEAFTRQLERGIIEVAPLAYMRGRTLDDSFIILDEAQNTTREQMKMFLTRLGANAKAVITGDITQIDIPDPRKSGLIDAVKILKDVEDIETVFLNEKDVVRNRIVQEIVKAYSKFESEVYEDNHGQSKSIN
ncbi:MAG: PhoH family protein [Oscillospiraceae bacterium]